MKYIDIDRYMYGLFFYLFAMIQTRFIFGIVPDSTRNEWKVKFVCGDALN